MNDLPTRLARSLMLPALALLIAGCMVGPDYQPPDDAAPSTWVGLTEQSSAAPSIATHQTPSIAAWWRTFNDPQMTALVDEALAANLDLQLAAARLRQARAARGVVAGGVWPILGASGSYQRTRSTVGGESVPSTRNVYQVGFDAAWELDLFGGIRRNIEAATADIEAAREDLRDAQVSLIAEVSLNYIQLRGLQQQIAIAQRNLQAQQHTADITRQRQQAGFVSRLDVVNAEAQVATTQAQIPELETATRQAIFALSALLARPPGDLLHELTETQPLPVTPPVVPVGLPSHLLRRRPDIRRAEAHIHAATAQIGVATADLFPKISLTGSVSWQSNLLQHWISKPHLSSALGPTLQWAIFQGGSVVSNIRLQEALRDQAFLTYRKAVITAFQDVENALVAFAKEWEHRQALTDAVTANREAVRLATLLYTQGQSDFLSLLNAQRSLYISEDALVRSNQATAADLIALYKALGGGWEIDGS
jgi:NodT family efflux transporter outer membrane factor (OMF) lipoprotein